MEKVSFEPGMKERKLL